VQFPPLSHAYGVRHAYGCSRCELAFVRSFGGEYS
jgi:hypothetical protein